MPIAFEPFAEDHRAFRRTVREFCERDQRLLTFAGGAREMMKVIVAEAEGL